MKQYLKKPYPVITGPGVFGAHCVVAIDSAFRKVTAPHVSKLHWPSLVHGNAKQTQACLTPRKKSIYRLMRQKLC